VIAKFVLQTCSNGWNWGQLKEGLQTHSYVFLDTADLEMNTVASITITIIDKDISMPNRYINKEFGSIKEKYEVLNKGVTEISGHKSHWIYFINEEERLATFLFYLFKDSKLVLFNASTSTPNSEQYMSKLCELLYYIRLTEL